MSMVVEHADLLGARARLVRKDLLRVATSQSPAKQVRMRRQA
ncbi:hypothetical protein D8I24_5562 [Cupriavidus necator H850]|nr:hypothetical protein D8I24_5562 [Cupriavidus necator H850]